MNLARRLSELAKLRSPADSVVSVYLDVRWADEQQRDRVRLFLKNHLRQARNGGGGQPSEADLDWIEAETLRLVEAGTSDINGVALFACQALDLRDIIPVRVSFENTFVVAETPWLRPFAAVLEETRPALVVFVDGESARLISLHQEGPGEELVLHHQVEGRHSSGGWAALAQSRYQRRIQTHRDRHFEAVAETVADVVDREDVARVVLAGEARSVALLRKHLPPAVDGRVTGVIAGARHEPAGKLGARGADFLARLEQSEAGAAVDTLLDDAATGERAVVGLPPTLEAVRRNSVQRLYLLRDFHAPGRLCEACDTLHEGREGGCPACGAETRSVELGNAMVDRVIATGGTAEVVTTHAGLARAGRIAARLRYAA